MSETKARERTANDKPPGKTLADVGLFSGLSADAVAEIEKVCFWRIVAEGEQVFDQTSTTDEVYFIVEGAVRVLTYTNTGREVALANVLSGDYFGELAAIDSRGRSARVVAVEDSVIAALRGADFMDIMGRHASIALTVVRRLAHIIRTLDSRVAELSQLSEGQRVLAELVRIAEPDPAIPNGWLISKVPNHKELASWAGTSREVVAQAIGELAREGIVERRTMGLRIKDWARLQLLARTPQAMAH